MNNLKQTLLVPNEAYSEELKQAIHNAQVVVNELQIVIAKTGSIESDSLPCEFVFTVIFKDEDGALKRRSQKAIKPSSLLAVTTQFINDVYDSMTE